jgi:hypothetical protein
MNLRFPTLAILLCLPFANPSVQGAGSTASPAAPPATKASQLAAAFAAASAAAEAAALRADSTGAETALVSLVSAYDPPADGELATANYLVQFALRTREKGFPDASALFTALALKHLTSCVQIATADQKDEIAGAWELRATIHLNLLGDRATALADLRQAVAASPNAQSAASMLQRLLAEDAAEQQKLAAWGEK